MRDITKQQFCSELLKMKPDAFLTLAPNLTHVQQGEWMSTTTARKIQHLRKKLYEFHKFTDRRILGRNFYKPTHRKRRTDFVVFPEKLETNPHVHLLVLIPEKKDMYMEIVGDCWKKATGNGGTSDIKLFHTSEDRENVISYVTKEAKFYIPASLDEGWGLLSGEFITA